MSFLTPFMLWGALAAGIPVAIHLFFRSRYRTVPWAAMKFLLTAVEQTSRRLKFQELLLLLLRMALLVMLAIAFARPISSGIKGSGRGEAVDAVFVFDLSYSMGASDGAKTRLQRAQEEATKIIDELPPHSTVQIVTSAGKMRNHLGPRSPGNLDQARDIVKSLELTHLATNLAGGVIEGEDAFKRGQASNKELYVFSDMQHQGFEEDADKLRSTLHEVKEKALVHMVRCGTRTLKNAIIESIVPQAGVPRPGERVSFAVVVRNTGSEAMSKIRVTLAADEDDKKLKGQAKADKELESAEIPKLAGGDSHAVTLSAKLAKPGLAVLTARIDHDDVPGDNRLDQVILVRDQARILVVDGSPNAQDPERASSYFLMHALLPVKETERPSYKFNARTRSANEVSATDLKEADICILANCALDTKATARAAPLSNAFLDALDAFVRQGNGLIVFSGDNVKPDAYNRVLGKKYGLTPTLKSVIKAKEKDYFTVNRGSFEKGPPEYWQFKEDDRFALFDFMKVFQHVEVDEAALKKEAAQVVMRLSNDKPLAVSKKVDKGEVIFIGTSSQPEGKDPSGAPNWTDFGTMRGLPPLMPFIDVTVTHLLRGQTQTYNVVAGQTLTWTPADKVDHPYDLVHPDRAVSRLGFPYKIEPEAEEATDEQKRKRQKLNLDRYVLTLSDLSRAGVYRIAALPKGAESSDSIDPETAIAKGTPIAVVPDARETLNLGTKSEKEINEALGFTPIHIVAGGEATSTGEDRLNREWTVWALLALLVMLLLEVALAWWCGRAW